MPTKLRSHADRLRAKHRKIADAERQTAVQRGYDRRWRKVRLLALQRDGYLCQHCLKREDRTPADEVHHIQPISKRPDLRCTVDNLVCLCRTCHAKAERV